MIKYSELNLGQIEAVVNKLGGMEGVRRLLAGTVEIIAKSILQLVNSEIKVSARECFVVGGNFKKGNAGIYYLGDNFQKWFGSKVETNIPASTLSSHKLMQSSLDGPIKTELGGNHETFLSWLFEKIEAQADGREGELLVSGYANIFYVDGRVVYAGWNVGFGWDVHAYEVTNPDAWNDGRRVFSRNSVLKSSETLVQAQA